MKFLTLKSIVTGLMLLSALNSYTQERTINRLVPDSIKFWKKGIYSTINDFYNNSPAITENFKVTNTNLNYNLYPGERDSYYLNYYNEMGIENQLEMSDIWGFFDGYKLFVVYKNKPYEMLFFGRISILRYESYQEKNIAAQAATLALFGVTTTSTYKIKDLFIDLRFNLILPKNKNSFEEIISKDVDFYSAYLNHAEMNSESKMSYFYFEYNKKYPVVMTEKGIEFLLKN